MSEDQKQAVPPSVVMPEKFEGKGNYLARMHWVSRQDHVHSRAGLCLKDRTGRCTAPKSVGLS